MKIKFAISAITCLIFLLLCRSQTEYEALIPKTNTQKNKNKISQRESASRNQSLLTLPEKTVEKSTAEAEEKNVFEEIEHIHVEGLP